MVSVVAAVGAAASREEEDEEKEDEEEEEEEESDWRGWERGIISSESWPNDMTMPSAQSTAACCALCGDGAGARRGARARPRTTGRLSS